MKGVKLVLIFVVIIAVVAGLLYFISTTANKSKSDKLELINKRYGYSKGVIVRLQSYKGHSIEVKYQIGNKDYKYGGGWDSNPHGLRKGDSISFRYALDAPEMIVTELDEGY
ncbi:hypothetical protein FHW36_113110 [Chitinophaga polysaccharea]|uniref:DUF3592 domain-containing protein n=1 Tax=Chitinophaga polysaccharea TaxID=1293035 RepID=A0A561P427_9BACT|nr:B3 domain-containing protein [Chitinophaga polysaccharea]TWF32855.1 hypothetical protein FHW36_113110 [Chitinophaga polysaccharea]